jgi:hypothetical protein
VAPESLRHVKAEQCPCIKFHDVVYTMNFYWIIN